MTPSNTLSIIASMATQGALQTLADEFAKTHKITVSVLHTGGVPAQRRIEQGEVFDMVFLANKAITQLAERGLLSTTADWVSSSIALAVLPSNTAPLASSDSIVTELKNANTIAYSTGPSGDYIKTLLADLAINTPQFVPPAGEAVGQSLLDGRADIGFQQYSELLPYANTLRLVQDLPAPFGLSTTFSAGVHAQSKNENLAKEFLRFINTTQANAVKTEMGLAGA